MKTAKGLIGDVSAKLIACAVIGICLVIGMMGLILPIVPGLLFLAIAVLVAASHFPWIDRRLRARKVVGRHLERFDAILELSLRTKLKLAALLLAKAALGGIAAVTALASGMRR